jgi:hypothetical protein
VRTRTAQLTGWDAGTLTATVDDGTGAVELIPTLGTFVPVVGQQVLIVDDGATSIVVGPFDDPQTGGGGGGGNDVTIAPTPPADPDPGDVWVDSDAVCPPTGPTAASLPAGVVVYTASPNPPDGWLVCDGRALAKADYPQLWTALGTTYGASGDAATFLIPNLRNTFVRGNLSPGVTGGAATH